MKNSVLTKRARKQAQNTASIVAENNRLLRLICERLEIDVNSDETESAEGQPAEIEQTETEQTETEPGDAFEIDLEAAESATVATPAPAPETVVDAGQNEGKSGKARPKR